MSVLDEMRKLICNRDYVSFVELSRIEGAKGPYRLMFSRLGNVVLWEGLSEEFCDAYDLMVHQGEMHMVPASSVLVYMCDGVTLNLPIVKGMRFYKKLHWLPVTFRPGPLKHKFSQRTIDRVAKFDARHVE